MAKLTLLAASLATALKAYGIQNMPTALQPAIQQNFLEREFLDGLQSKLGFRSVAERQPFPTGVGETITKTRKGLKAPVTTPMNPANNTNLDNGMTPSSWAVEQYTMELNQYGDTIDLNIVTSGVGIAKQFLANAKTNGIQAQQSLDRLARNALFNAYMGGNTFVTATLGAPGTSVAVDDIRGFTWAISNGKPLPVSGSNVLAITINGTAYNVVGATADVTNVSSTKDFGGISGTLTLSANVSVSNGTTGNAVLSGVAPSLYRAGDHATTAGILATEKLTMKMVQAAVADLRSNNVPDIDGAYNCFLTSRQMTGLYRDPEFQLLYRGAYNSDTYESGKVTELLGVRFIETTEIPTQRVGSVNVYRALICGDGALVEGNYEGVAAVVPGVDSADAGMIAVADGIVMVTREPLDRDKQIIAQSWYAIVGFAVPTDTTVNTSIIPTSTTSAFKRAVMLESA